MKKRKIIIRLTVGFLILMVVCTMLSRTVYRLMLPDVRVASPTTRSLTDPMTYAAQIGYRNTEDVTAQVEWEVLTVDVQVGSEVKAGQQLMTVQSEKSDLERKQLVLNQKMAQTRVNSAAGMEREQAQIDLEKAELALREHDEIYPKDGIVVAKKDGIVCEVNCKPNQTVTGTLIRVKTADTSYDVTWEVPMQNAGKFELDDTVECIVSNSESLLFQGKPPISEISLPDETGMVTMTAAFAAQRDIFTTDAATVTMTPPSTTYETVVPRSSLQKTGDSDAIYVVNAQPGIFGENLTVRLMPVTVLEQNNRYAAIQVKLERTDRIVVNTSKPLVDGADVKIVE